MEPPVPQPGYHHHGNNIWTPLGITIKRTKITSVYNCHCGCSNPCHQTRRTICPLSSIITALTWVPSLWVQCALIPEEEEKPMVLAEQLLEKLCGQLCVQEFGGHKFCRCPLKSQLCLRTTPGWWWWCSYSADQQAPHPRWACLQSCRRWGCVRVPITVKLAVSHIWLWIGHGKTGFAHKVCRPGLGSPWKGPESVWARPPHQQASLLLSAMQGCVAYTGPSQPHPNLVSFTLHSALFLPGLPRHHQATHTLLPGTMPLHATLVPSQRDCKVFYSRLLLFSRLCINPIIF